MLVTLIVLDQFSQHRTSVVLNMFFMQFQKIETNSSQNRICGLIQHQCSPVEEVNRSFNSSPIRTGVGYITKMVVTIIIITYSESFQN